MIGLTDVMQIASGWCHTLARRDDGTVWAWGCNYEGELGNGSTTQANIPAQVPGLVRIGEIDAGGETSLAVDSDGRVYAWGANNCGQLGNGSTTRSKTPIQVGGLTDVTSVCAGLRHSMAVSHGLVYAWGCNTSGELGDGTTTQRLTPVQVLGLTGISVLAAGDSHTIALNYDGTVWTWGSNTYGQLGDGTTIQRTRPVQIQGIGDAIAIGAGPASTFVMLHDGRVLSWGRNDYGQLGDGARSTMTVVANKVPGLPAMTAISAGGNFSLAMDGNYNLWAWGYNDRGQLGDYTTTQRSRPVILSRPSGVRAFSTGLDWSIASDSEGRVWTWGSNGGGQLGLGTIDGNVHSSATMVPGITGVIAVAAGISHALALKNDGTLWAWGNNLYGQLGDGTTQSRYSPGAVFTMSGLTNVKAIAACGNHNMALKSDGTVWAWGISGTSGDGAAVDRYVPVQVPGLSGIIAIAAGNIHDLALASDGSVWAWGDNYYGELGDGTYVNKKSPVKVAGLTGAQDLAAGGGYGFSVALMTDGTVTGWGSNASGQLGNPNTVYRTPLTTVAGMTDMIDVSAGQTHLLGLRKDGTVWAVGSNSFGQIGDGYSTLTPRPMVRCINSVNVTPAIVGRGDSVTVEVGAYDATAVTANGRALTLNAGVWRGQIGVLPILGDRTAHIVATMTNGDTETATATYKVGRVYGIRCRSLLDDVLDFGRLNNLYKCWGLVSIIDKNSFSLYDGSSQITVVCPGYSGLINGSYAAAQGVISADGWHLWCAPNRVTKLK